MEQSDYLGTPSEWEIKSLQYTDGYVIHKLHKRLLFPFLLQCKVDSDLMSLVTAWDRGGLWKVGTIFLECEKNISIFYIAIPISVKIFRFGFKNAKQFYSCFKFTLLW